MSNNTQQQVKMNINLDNLKIVTCPQCKNSVFKTNLSIFKKLPLIQSPTRKAQLIRIDLISCLICNSIYTLKDTELFPVSLEKHKIGVLKDDASTFGN